MADVLQSSETLFAKNDDKRVSADGRFTLIMQKKDGNLVLYGPGGALWKPPGAVGANGYVTMEVNGDLVIYDSTGTAKYHSKTNGNVGASLVVTNDGNITINSNPNWTNGTMYPV